MILHWLIGWKEGKFTLWQIINKTLKTSEVTTSVFKCRMSSPALPRAHAHARTHARGFTTTFFFLSLPLFLLMNFSYFYLFFSSSCLPSLSTCFHPSHPLSLFAFHPAFFPSINSIFQPPSINHCTIVSFRDCCCYQNCVWLLASLYQHSRRHRGRSNYTWQRWKNQR